jgi:hypothetical protein
MDGFFGKVRRFIPALDGLLQLPGQAIGVERFLDQLPVVEAGQPFFVNRLEGALEEKEGDRVKSLLTVDEMTDLISILGLKVKVQKQRVGFFTIQGFDDLCSI